MPLFPRNPIFKMIIDAAVVSYALTLVTVGTTYLIIYALRELRLI